jgi:predicted nucleotidyltransferase
MELGRPLSTITPTLDGDVLVVLANHDVTFTTGQLSRVLPHYSEAGIRKVLQRLVGQGVVLADRIGNAFAYRLNRDHLAAEHIIGLAQLQKTFLERVEDLLESWGPVKPQYAAIFGSVARGSMTTDSDVDLLLVKPRGVDEDLWEARVGGLAAEVTKWVGNDVRVLEFTAAEIAARGRAEPVLKDVLAEGLTVAGSRAWLVRQLRKG